MGPRLLRFPLARHAGDDRVQSIDRPGLARVYVDYEDGTGAGRGRVRQVRLVPDEPGVPERVVSYGYEEASGALKNGALSDIAVRGRDESDVGPTAPSRTPIRPSARPRWATTPAAASCRS